MVAYRTSAHSARFGLQIPTWSPTSSPAAIRARDTIDLGVEFGVGEAQTLSVRYGIV
ncbi:MAG: hypothetical protein AABM43_13865 [Actinomycetota bacterium]